MNVLKGFEPNLVTFAVSRNGKSMATISHGGRAELWDLVRQRPVGRFFHEDPFSVALSPNGDLLATLSRDQSARIWRSPAKGDLQFNLDRNIEIVGAKSDANGTQLLTSARTGNVDVWSSDRTGVLFSLSGHTGRVTKVVQNSDGRYLASGSLDRSARLWNAANGQPVRRSDGVEVIFDHGTEVIDIAFSPDGRYLATYGWDSGTRAC